MTTAMYNTCPKPSVSEVSPCMGIHEISTGHDEHCWTTINTGMQGEGLIKGTYHDYVVSDILSTDFKFKPTL